MSPILRATLQAGLVRNLCQTPIEVHRFTLTEDGRGGVTETWRKVADYKGRLSNQSDTESIVGGGIQPSAGWNVTLPVSADVMAHDRVYVTGDDSKYYDVVGTDFGQTDLLVQHVGLVERTA
jgi:head-tail adaptor